LLSIFDHLFFITYAFCHCGLFSLRFDEILSYQLHYHFGMIFLIHLSDVGLLNSVPYTGREVNYLLLHLRNKINSFYCYFEFS